VERFKSSCAAAAISASRCAIVRRPPPIFHQVHDAPSEARDREPATSRSSVSKSVCSASKPTLERSWKRSRGLCARVPRGWRPRRPRRYLADRTRGRGSAPASGHRRGGHEVLVEHHLSVTPRSVSDAMYRMKSSGMPSSLERRSRQLIRREPGHRARHHARSAIGGRRSALPALRRMKSGSASTMFTRRRLCSRQSALGDLREQSPSTDAPAPRDVHTSLVDSRRRSSHAGRGASEVRFNIEGNRAEASARRAVDGPATQRRDEVFNQHRRRLGLEAADELPRQFLHDVREHCAGVTPTFESGHEAIPYRKQSAILAWTDRKLEPGRNAATVAY